MGENGWYVMLGNGPVLEEGDSQFQPTGSEASPICTLPCLYFSFVKVGWATRGGDAGDLTADCGCRSDLTQMKLQL